MANTEALVKLDAGGTASMISYNVPEPTAYNGQFVIELSDLPATYFLAPPSAEVNNLCSIDRIKTAMRNGFADPEIFPGVGVQPYTVKYVEPTDASPAWRYRYYYYGNSHYYQDFYGVVPYNQGYTYIYQGPGGYHWYYGNNGPQGQMSAGSYPIGPSPWDQFYITWNLACLTPNIVQSHMLAGERLAIFKNILGQWDYQWVNWESRPRLAIVQKVRLSNYLGCYGAGRVVQTFSLLPGEKTKISVKTYKRSTETRKGTSSILDSYTDESAQEFSRALAGEHSNKKDEKSSLSWHVEAQAEVNYGFVAAKVSAGYKGAINSSNEQFGKEMKNTVQKTAAKTSSKRDMRVEQTEETRLEEGEETGIEREIQNINSGRTLNFVFRQMNQEFISLLHLTDVLIGYHSGLPGGAKYFPLSQLEDVLNTYIANDASGGAGYRNAVRTRILDELQAIFDHQGNCCDFTEYTEIRDPTTNNLVEAPYWRTRSDMLSTYDAGSGMSVTVSGIILESTRTIMRTSGLMVEALLGQGNGLDAYSQTLQTEAVRKQRLSNDAAMLRNSHDQMVLDILRNQDEVKAGLYAKIYPKPSLQPSK